MYKVKEPESQLGSKAYSQNAMHKQQRPLFGKLKDQQKVQKAATVVYLLGA